MTENLCSKKISLCIVPLQLNKIVFCAVEVYSSRGTGIMEYNISF